MNIEFEKVELDQKSASRRRTAIVVGVFIAVVILGICAGLLVRYYVVTTFIVNGSSMAPTLDGGGESETDGEILYLNKLAKIKRGDIIVFTPQWIEDGDGVYRTLVKRVIAVAGDHILIEDNNVYVNGQLLNEPYLAEDMRTPDLEMTVPDDMVFCMGDNRNNSSDSRMFGPAPLSCVVGRCFLIKGTNGKLRRP